MEKKILKQQFRVYLREIASTKIESGNDTFMRIMSGAMGYTVSVLGMSVRQYWMRYDKPKYEHYVRALRLNMNYSMVNELDYGKHSWLNCNNVDYIK